MRLLVHEINRSTINSPRNNFQLYSKACVKLVYAIFWSFILEIDIIDNLLPCAAQTMISFTANRSLCAR